MKFSSKFRYYNLCLLALSASLFACSESDSYDVVGDSQNKLYVNLGAWSPIDAPKNSFAFEVVHTPIGDFGSVAAKFPVKISRPAANDVTAKMEVDNSLVDSYNSLHGTSFAKLPDGVLDLSSATATINKGLYQSLDSVSIAIANNKLALLTEKKYLVPVKISSSTDKSIGISQDNSTTYLVISTSVNRIQSNIGSAKMDGALASSLYSSWTVTTDATPTKGTVANIFDGSTSTNWRFSTTPVTFTIDMKAAQNVTGFRAYCQYANYGYVFGNVDVSLSNDGTTWDYVGKATNSTMANEGGYQYISFYGAYQARYVKLTFSWLYSYYPYICELGVYVK